MDAAQLTPALAEIFLATVAILLVLPAAFLAPDTSARFLRRVSIIVLLLTGGLVHANGGEPASALGGFFITSGFAVYMKSLVLAGAVLVMLMARPHLRADGIHKPEFSLLVLFATLGMMVMISAGDLMALYMGLELQSLPLYVIAAMRRESLRASEAGLKYFLLGALSSGLLLYGISLVYGFTGSTGYAAIAESLAAFVSPGAVVGIVFMLAGIAFKVSAAPFHMWAPDVYEGAPTIVTAFFAIVPKVAAMALFLQMTYSIFAPAADAWQQVTIALGVLSMIVGALGAIMQTSLKRLMAYSSIAHMGYILVGMSAATEQGLAAVMLYLTIYVLSAVGVFAVILSMEREGEGVTAIADLQGYSKTHPLRALAMLVFLFSMAGIPPFGGFFGKWFAFLAAVDAGLVIVAVIAVLASVIGAFYYLRIIKVMYIDAPDSALDESREPIRDFIIAFMAAAVALFVFALSFLRENIALAVQSLLG